MDPQPLNPPPLDILLASLCYLMSRHALNPDPTLAEAVSQHPAMLAQHPGCHSEVLAKVGHRLASCSKVLAQGRAASTNAMCH